MKKTALFLLFILTSLSAPGDVFASSVVNPIAPASTTVSAVIGEAKLILFGYGPVNSEVYAIGIGILDSTISNSSGYYQFDSIFLPNPTKEKDSFYYPELCIYAVDKNGVTSTPTCIPPLKAGNRLYYIGPVNLPPTISLSKGEIITTQQSKISGFTTPNSEVDIIMARNNTPGNFFQFVKETYAYYIKPISTKSDSSGYYEINLPSDSPATWRTYTASKILGSQSPKSNTLIFKVLPRYYSIIDSFFVIFSFLRKYYFPLLLAINLILAALIWKHRKSSSLEVSLPKKRG